MRIIKNFLWLIFTFIWSQFYVFLLLIGLAFLILFVIVSVKIARGSMEDYMTLIKALAYFLAPALLSLFGGIFGLKKLLGNTTIMGKLLGLVVLPIAGYIAYKGFVLYWSDFVLAFGAFKSTLFGMWKA